MTRRTITRRANCDESGVALVEFAFVLVLFVMLLWGIITFGYAWSLKEQEYHSAQEGLRSALIVPSNSSSDDHGKRDAAVDAARQKLVAMLGTTDSQDPTLSILTSNCVDPLNPNGQRIVCPSTGPMQYAPCKTTLGGDEANTKCMTITLTYQWTGHEKIAPMPGIFPFMPDTIHASATGKVQ